MLLAAVFTWCAATLQLGAATTFDLTSASIVDINAAFDAGALTSNADQLFLARIDAYDKKGPALNAVLWLNPMALDEARALDAERKRKGPRGLLHGIPVLLKDNIDTVGLPTTAGFYGSGTRCPRRMPSRPAACAPPVASFLARQT